MTILAARMEDLIRWPSGGIGVWPLRLLILLFLALAVFVLGRLLMFRAIEMRQRLRPFETYFSLCRTLGLRWRDGWLLLRIARRCELASPITLMLSPATLDHHARQYCETITYRQRARVRRMIDEICGALFGRTPAVPPSSQAGQQPVRR